MATRALTVLSSACAATGACIVYVHYSQVAERQRMHAGVLRDIALEHDEKAARASATLASLADCTDESGGICALATRRFKDVKDEVQQTTDAAPLTTQAAALQ